jgi:hypothetical protein
MAGFTGTLAAQVMAFLTNATSGVNARITAMEANDPDLKAAGIRSILSQNVSVEIAESAGQQDYPVLLVYCERVQNLLREKFRGFSGRVHLTIEVRHTQEKLALLEQYTETYVDAICALLGEARGDWGDGASYSGGYQVEYEPVAMGGKNFVQRAKVTFAVELSE